VEDLTVSQEKLPEETIKILQALKSTRIFEDMPLPTDNETIPQFQLLHRLGSRLVPFDNEKESDGTMAYLSLIAPIIESIEEGGLLCVDELDSSLHPLLAMKILQIFGAKATNPLGAQLIANTHDTNLLGRGLLRRDQIWFTEKGRDGESHLYPLTDFKPRRNENLESGYLQGRYGAIPFLDSDLSECVGGIDEQPQ
jgi:AAA15 family ATPase/GTPase